MKKAAFRILILAIITVVISTSTNCSTNFIDDIAPTCNIIFPIEGQEVSGTITIVVAASDNEKLYNVLLFIDAVNVFSSKETLFNYTWDTSSYADGKIHSIQAVAYDEDDNAGFSDKVVVTVVP